MDIKLFALGASGAYAGRVAARLGVSLAAHEEREFEDGEHKARPLESVRGADVYVLQALHGEPGASANDKLCRLLFFIGALRDAGAARVSGVLPYAAYQRKDRRTKARDPLTTRYLAQLLEAMGAGALVVLEAHNPAAFENAARIPVLHLPAVELFAAHYAAPAAAGTLAIASPDPGGYKRADALREALGARTGRPIPLAFLGKRRSGGVLTPGDVAGEVEGRDVVVYDDLIATGATLAHAAAALRARGVRSVQAAAAHGLFATGAAVALRAPALDGVVVSDSVPERAWRERPGAPVTVLDSTALLAAAIRRLHGGTASVG